MLFACCLFSQNSPTARVQPGQGTVAVQSDEGESSTSDTPVARLNRNEKGDGFIRLWNFAEKNSASGIGVFLAKDGRIVEPEQRLWLARGSRNGEVRSYLEVPPGKYDVIVLRDASQQGAMVDVSSLAAADKDFLSKPIPVEITEGAFFTVVVRDVGDSLDVEVLSDHKVSAKALRLFNFSDEDSVIVSVLNPGGAPTVISKLGQEPVIATIPPSLSSATFEVSYPSDLPGKIASMNVEADFTDVISCSLIVAHDRYGRLSIIARPDAPIIAVGKATAE